VPPPAAQLWPITGLDVARALGLPASTPAMDTAALTACQVIEPYLDRTKLEQLDELPQPVVEACLVLAIDVLQNRTAAGGQNVGIDGSVGPYRMGRSLLDRVSGLLGPWLDTRSELG
jgi:hypothetical protein